MPFLEGWFKVRSKTYRDFEDDVQTPLRDNTLKIAAPEALTAPEAASQI